MPLTYEEVTRRIAQNVRQLRLEKGLTQEGLAHYAQIATRHLQKVEAAEVNITIDTLTNLANALNVEPAYLLEER